MPEFDIEGLGRARMNLAALGKNSVVNHDMNLKRALVTSLYVEIRSARIAGHCWRSIRNAITSNVKIRFSEVKLSQIFEELDREYEKNTGVKALPPSRKYNAKRSAKKAMETQ